MQQSDASAQIEQIAVILEKYDDVPWREDVAALARLIVLVDTPPSLPHSKSLPRIVECECERIRSSLSKGAPIRSPVGLLRAAVRKETRTPTPTTKFVDHERKVMIRPPVRTTSEAKRVEPQRLAVSCASALGTTLKKRPSFG